MAVHNKISEAGKAMGQAYLCFRGLSENVWFVLVIFSL